MTKLIQQRKASDCAIACLAMALAKTYEETVNAVPHALWTEIQASGTSIRAMHAVLGALGLSQNRDYCLRSYSPHWGTIGATKNLLWGRRCICAVWSSNNSGGWHFVYYDGENLFDPSPGKTYESWSEVEPMDMWIFNENPQSPAELS